MPLQSPLGNRPPHDADELVFFVPDLLSQTAHLTTEEFGAYVRALAFVERQGRVDYFDDSLAVAAGIDPTICGPDNCTKWESIRSKIAPLLNVSGDYIYAAWANG